MIIFIQSNALIISILVVLVVAVATCKRNAILAGAAISVFAYVDFALLGAASTWYVTSTLKPALAIAEAKKFISPLYVLGVGSSSLIWPTTAATKHISNAFVQEQIFLGLAILMLVMFALSKSTKGLSVLFGGSVAKRKHGEEHGSARWARLNELKKILTNGPSGTILGTMKGQTLFLPEVVIGFNQNTLVVGPSGSGKSWSLLRPAIMQAIRNQESIIVTDPKGELVKDMKSIMEENSYIVKVLNLVDLKIGDQYNPFSLIVDDQDALDLASVLVEADSSRSSGEQFWDDALISYYQAIILYIVHELPLSQRHIRNLLEIAARWGADKENIDSLFLALDPQHPARCAYDLGFRVAADKIRDGIIISAAAKLAIWQSMDVCSLTSGEGINIAQIGKEKTALFLKMSTSKKTMRPVSQLFFNQLFQILFHVGEENGGQLPVKVRILADELGNIGKIFELEKRLSLTRSYGIGFMGIFQNVKQMESMYPDFQSIKANCHTFVFLGGGDHETLKFVSNILGEQTIETQSNNESEQTTRVDTSGSMGLSTSTSRRMLMTPDEVGRIKKEDMIVQLSGEFPAIMQKYDYTKHPLAKKLIPKMLTKEMFTIRAEVDLFALPPEASDQKTPINYSDSSYI